MQWKGKKITDRCLRILFTICWQLWTNLSGLRPNCYLVCWADCWLVSISVTKTVFSCFPFWLVMVGTRRKKEKWRWTLAVNCPSRTGADQCSICISGTTVQYEVCRYGNASSIVGLFGHRCCKIEKRCNQQQTGHGGDNWSGGQGMWLTQHMCFAIFPRGLSGLKESVWCRCRHCCAAPPPNAVPAWDLPTAQLADPSPLQKMLCSAH